MHMHAGHYVMRQTHQYNTCLSDTLEMDIVSCPLFTNPPETENVIFTSRAARI